LRASGTADEAPQRCPGAETVLARGDDPPDPPDPPPTAVTP
jgi:hypothetical protein